MADSQGLGAVQVQYPQRDAAPNLNEFHVWHRETLARNSIASDDPADRANPAFVTEAELKAYLTVARIDGLLQNIFPQRPLVDAPTISQYCLRVFAILVAIGRGEYIERFVEAQELWDCPFYAKPNTWPGPERDHEFWDDFYQMQWEFSPVAFKRLHYKIHKHQVLPFAAKKVAYRGGSANIYSVLIHKDLDGFCGETLDNHREYVLKTYRGPHAKLHYDIESSSFKKLWQSEGREPIGIVKCLCAFEHNGTYNLLMETAVGGSLEQALLNEAPPTSGEANNRIWSAFLNCMKGLSRIHNLCVDQQDYQGLHADIKPSNILLEGPLVQDGNGEPNLMVIGDLGLCYFARNQGNGRETAVLDVVSGQTYAAPECVRRAGTEERRKLMVTQKIDVWALGCVILQLATWIVHGPKGVHDFQHARVNQNQRIGLGVGAGAGDRFHDGTMLGNYDQSMDGPHYSKRLKIVDEQLKALRSDIRRADKMTGHMLNLAEDMLQSDPVQRPAMDYAVAKVERCLQTALNRPNQSESSSGTSRYSTSGTSNVHSEPSPYGPPDGVNAQPSVTWNRQPLPRNPAYRSNPTRQIFDSREISDSPAGTRIEGFGIPETLQRDEGAGRLRSGRYDRTLSEVLEQNSRDISQESGVVSAPPAQQGPFHQPLRSLGSRTNAPEQSSPPHRSRTMPYRTQSPRTPEARWGPGANGYPDNFHRRSQEHGVPPFEVPIQLGESAQIPPSEPEASSPPQSPPSAQRNSRSPTSPVSPTPKKQRPPVPTLSREEALRWKDKHKDWRRRKRNPISTAGVQPQLPRHDLLAQLQRREVIFLVDDAWSMEGHWDAVVGTIEILAYIVKAFDDNGMDLYFTVSQKSFNAKDSSPLVRAVEKHKPSGETDINVRLSRILTNCEVALHDQQIPSVGYREPESRAAAKQTSIFVLTDGLWTRGDDAAGPIKKMIDTLEKFQYTRQHIGIQFIRFGGDDQAEGRLQALDDLSEQPDITLDIVDTEHWKGNVYKMLLGPINAAFDEA